MKKITKEIMKILILFTIYIGAFGVFNVIFATSDPYTVISSVLKSVLNALMWFAYAIALGILIFIGIKYILSGANEKANLKQMLPKYLIGMALILMCFTIANGVAQIAGNDTAEEVIQVGEEAGEHFAVDNGGSFMTEETLNELSLAQEHFKDNASGSKSELEGNVEIWTPDGIDINEIEYKNPWTKDPTVTAPKTIGDKSFKYWYVERTNREDGYVTRYLVYSNEYTLEGADSAINSHSKNLYMVYPIYE